eukprot:augustus_masked-scaffold_7-processed-gene-3.4-mRNA-1 protein AED:1.00 eAED:1.00 QI:0/0/0/0/1/1/3/0/1344
MSLPIAVGVAETTLLYLKHGQANSELQQIKSDNGTVGSRYRAMMDIYLRTQLHVILPFGFHKNGVASPESLQEFSQSLIQMVTEMQRSGNVDAIDDLTDLQNISQEITRTLTSRAFGISEMPIVDLETLRGLSAKLSANLQDKDFLEQADSFGKTIPKPVTESNRQDVADKVGEFQDNYIVPCYLSVISPGEVKGLNKDDEGYVILQTLFTENIGDPVISQNITAGLMALSTRVPIIRYDRFMNKLKEGSNYGFLSLYFYTVSEAEEIAEEMKSNSTLKYLSMPSCYAGSRKILPIINAMKENPRLRISYLDLSDNRLEDNGCYVVCNFLKFSTTVEVAILKANRITSQAASYIKGVLVKSKTLKWLDIGNNQLGPEGVKILDQAFDPKGGKPLPILELLDISDNKLGSEGVKNLTNIFSNSKTMKNLNMQYNNIGSEGADTISHLISTLPEYSLLERITLLDKYTRILVLRGLLEKSLNEEEYKSAYSKVLFEADKFDKKMSILKSEWEKAKENGDELVKIPQEVFEYQDADSIRAFVKQAISEGLSSNKAVKMLMVGRARAGKTSLTNALVGTRDGPVDGEEITALTKDDDNRATVSVEIRPWVVDDVRVSVWDFAGQEERCVVVLILDLSRYKDFSEDVYYWVKAIQAHIPGVSFFLVGTHIDEMTAEEVKEKQSEILLKFEQEEQRVVAALDKQLELLQETNDEQDFEENKMERIKTKNEDINRDLDDKATGEGADSLQVARENANIVVEDTAQMKQIREQRDNRPKILHNKMYVVSSKDLKGVTDLRKVLIKHATAEEVAIRLPNTYVRLLESLKEFADANPASPILLKEKLESIVPQDLLTKFDTKEEIESALDLLHIVGQILWYKHNEKLVDRIFTSPRWVVDVTKALIRHDMFLTEHGNPGIIPSLECPNGMKSKEFELLRKNFQEQAVLDSRLLPLLETWNKLSVENQHKLAELLQQFDLLIQLPRVKNQISLKCLIPLYLNPKFKELMKGNPDHEKAVVKLKPMGKQRVSWRYDLTEYFPEGLFLRALVRCFSFGEVETISDKVLLMRVGNSRIRLMEDRSSGFMTLTGSYEPEEGKKKVKVFSSVVEALKQVWPALVLFATEIEALLRTAYKGLNYQVVCVASDSRLRERALCANETHPDMVPSREYMHVIWGTLSATQLAILLRLENLLKKEPGKKQVKMGWQLMDKLLNNLREEQNLALYGKGTIAHIESLLSKATEGSEEYKALLELKDVAQDKKDKTIKLDNTELLTLLLDICKRLLPDLNKADEERRKRELKQANRMIEVEPTQEQKKDKNVMRLQLEKLAVEQNKFIKPKHEGIGENEDVKELELDL